MNILVYSLTRPVTLSLSFCPLHDPFLQSDFPKDASTIGNQQEARLNLRFTGFKLRNSPLPVSHHPNVCPNDSLVHLYILLPFNSAPVNQFVLNAIYRLAGKEYKGTAGLVRKTGLLGGNCSTVC